VDKKFLLDEALAFFGFFEFPDDSTLHQRYKALAKKYHPDSGEYSSPVVFQELQRHFEVLKSIEVSKKTPEKKESDTSFVLYKTAKDLETKAILAYFDKTAHFPMDNKEARKIPLDELKHSLTASIIMYEEVVKSKGIWSEDASRSIKRCSVWWSEEN